MGREVGGGIGVGKTCEPKVFSFQCMTKFTTKKNTLFIYNFSKRIIFDIMSPAIIICKSNKTWCSIFELATIHERDTSASEIVLQSFAITSIMYFQIRVLAIA